MIVRGNLTHIGAYVVWTCKVQTLDVSLFDVWRLQELLADDSAGRTNYYQKEVT